MKPEAGRRAAVDRWTIGFLVLAATLALAVGSAQAAGPANDNFSDAQLLSGAGGTVTGTNAGATREPGEPDLTGLGMGFTVWYSWTAPSSGQFEFNTNGSDFNTVLGIWTGSRVDALTYVAVNDSGGGGSSYDRIALRAAAGTTYRVQVDGRGFPTPTGTIVLNWMPLPAPANDDFEAAQPVTGLSATIGGDTWGATAQAGEPRHAGYSLTPQNSVWYRWTAPFDAETTFRVDRGSNVCAIGVYTGAALGALTEVANNNASGDCEANFDAREGTTYSIAVDFIAAASAFTLRLITWPPVNDEFWSPEFLSGETGTWRADNAGATKDTGEPAHAGNAGGASIWFRITVRTGTVTLDTVGSDFDTLLGVYTGGSVNSLTQVAADDDSGGAGTSRLTFETPAEQGYYRYVVAVDGKAGAVGHVVLNWTASSAPIPRPPNDDFANAESIAGATGSAKGTTDGATYQSGELIFGTDSVWYRWTAPVTGVVAFDTAGSSFDTTLTASYGAMPYDFDDLLIAANDNDGTATTSRIRFEAIHGFTYDVRVSGRGHGEVVLNWALTPPVPPPNDAFAAATPLSGQNGFVSDANAGASKETGEPNHAGNPGGRSVWYRWTAPASGQAVFRVQTDDDLLFEFGVHFDFVLAVYAGDSVGGLVEIASNNDWDGKPVDRVAFNATAGTTYSIAIDGFDGAETAIELGFHLIWNAAPPAPNDDFAAAIELDGDTGGSASTNAGATKETGEPDHGGSRGGASVWWRWTAPVSGWATFGDNGSSYEFAGRIWAVYTGTSVGALTEVAVGRGVWGNFEDSVSFRTTAGTTYSIAVEAPVEYTGRIGLTWYSTPVNDDFAKATTIQGANGSLTDTNIYGTLEPGEPRIQGLEGHNSVWYRWTAPQTGTVTFDTCGSSSGAFHPILGVYTGSSVDSLTVVAESNDSFCLERSQVWFTARAGTTYFVSVQGKYGETSFTLGWEYSSTTTWTPQNDNFANAELSYVGTSFPSGLFIGSNMSATKESGEPNHAGNPGGHSVWYRFEAHSTGVVTVDTLGSGFDTVVGVYTGLAQYATVGSLTPVASNDNAPGALTSRVSFKVNYLSTYWLAVDGAGGEVGTLRVNWTFAPLPPNDDFANAGRVVGEEGTGITSTGGATKEAGEPNHAGDPGGHSVWYTWQAPVHGTVTVDTAGSDFDTVLAAYTGTSVSALRAVAANDDDGVEQTSRIRFPVRAGREYRFAVDGAGGATGRATFHVKLGPAENLIVNGSFEGSVAGWSTSSAALSLVGGGAVGTNAAGVALSVRSKTFSLQPTTKPVASTLAGSVYAAQAWVRSDRPGESVCLTIREWSGTSIAASARTCVTATSGWAQIPELAYTAAASGRKLDLSISQTNARSGDSFETDGVTLYAGL